MIRSRPSAFESELEGRLTILTCGETEGRRLPSADMIALAAITTASFAIVLITQAL